MIPHMTYPQYRTVQRLVHSCCNYDRGNCLLLDDGEECVCPQSISYSLICRCPVWRLVHPQIQPGQILP